MLNETTDCNDQSMRQSFLERIQFLRPCALVVWNCCMVAMMHSRFDSCRTQGLAATLQMQIDVPQDRTIMELQTEVCRLRVIESESVDKDYKVRDLQQLLDSANEKLRQASEDASAGRCMMSSLASVERDLNQKTSEIESLTREVEYTYIVFVKVVFSVSHVIYHPASRILTCHVSRH